MWCRHVLIILLLPTPAEGPSKENYPKITDHQSSSQSERPNLSTEKVPSEYSENSTQAIDILQQLENLTIPFNYLKNKTFENQDENINSRIKEKYKSRVTPDGKWNCTNKNETLVSLESTCTSPNSLRIDFSCDDHSDQILACFKDPSSKCLSHGGQTFKRYNSGECFPLDEDYHEKQISNQTSKHDKTETNEATPQREEKLHQIEEKYHQLNETISILTEEGKAQGYHGIYSGPQKLLDRFWNRYSGKKEATAGQNNLKELDAELEELKETVMNIKEKPDNGYGIWTIVVIIVLSIIIIIILAVVIYCNQENLKQIFVRMKRSIQTQISESNRPNSNEVDQSNGETIEMDEIESQNPSRISEPNSSNSTEVAKSNDTFKDSPAMSAASGHSEFSTSTIPHHNGHPSSCFALLSNSSTSSSSVISSNEVNQTSLQPGLG